MRASRQQQAIRHEPIRDEHEQQADAAPRGRQSGSGTRCGASLPLERLDGVDPEIITTAETVAISVPGVTHAHARARWTGRTLRVEVEGFLDPDTALGAADQLGRDVAFALASHIPQMHSFTWTALAA